MKLYEKIIDGKQHCKPANKIVIRKDGMQTFNPTEEMLLADGWKVHEPVPYEPTEEEILNREKEYKIEEILRHDSSHEIHWKYEHLDSLGINALQPYTIYYGGTVMGNVTFGVPMSGNVPDYYEVRALFWVAESTSISFLTMGDNQNLTVVWPNGIPEINEGYYELSIAVDLNARVAYAILVSFKEL